MLQQVSRSIPIPSVFMSPEPCIILIVIIMPTGWVQQVIGRMQSRCSNVIFIIFIIVFIAQQNSKCESPSLGLSQKALKRIDVMSLLQKQHMSMTEQACAATRRGGVAALLTHRYTCAPVYLIELVASCHTTSTPAREHTNKYSHSLGEKVQSPEGCI